jgi:hypothetical protein
MRIARRKVALLMTLVVSQSCFGYGPNMHRAITDAAFGNSQRVQQVPSADWGIADTTFPSFSAADGTLKGVQALLRDGVLFEDQGTRPGNHFFDPTHRGSALSTCIGTTGWTSSPDWIINGTGQSGQEFSYSSARKAMLAGLISPNFDDRNAKLGEMFRNPRACDPPHPGHGPAAARS